MDSMERAPGDEQRIDQRPGAASPSARSTAEILIVDDDTRSLYALERILEGSDLRIVTARTGEEALKHVLNHDFALILLDVRMAGMDGYDTAALIRRREKSRHIPIIFLTAVDKDDVHMFRGYSAGAVDYVFKPVEPLILKSKVNVFVELFRKTEEIRQEERLKRQLEVENLRVRSEKLRAEQALRLSEERQSLIINSLPLALYAAPFAGRYAGVRFHDGSIERLSGFPASAFEDTEGFWAERIHPDDRDRVLREMAAMPSAGSLATEYRWRRADGSYRFFYDRAVVVRDRHGMPEEIFGMWLDVTEHRQLEQQLVQSRKMDAIGQLTGGIAHDFSNMLTAVLSNLDLLRRSLKPGGRAARRAETALQSALRCAELTQRLLYFARQKPLQRGAVDLGATATGMSEILSQTLDERIAIEMKIEPGSWAALADQSQIESSLLNLVINARDALPDGGKVIVEVANATLDEPFEDENFQATAGDYVMLSVADNGIGMPAEVRARMFEPFFTTKEPGHGTGLGLSMTYSFVRECGGFIRIRSEIGCGTVVSLYFKRAATAADHVSSTSDPALCREAQDNETILVVEDDVEVLRATAETLRELGYDVLEAETAAAALELLASGRRVDLMFTDIAMPGGLSGRQLAGIVAERYPSLRVLYTSGYANRVAGGAQGDATIRLLKKPYRDYELADAIRETLDHGAPAAAGPETASPARAVEQIR